MKNLFTIESKFSPYTLEHVLMLIVLFALVYLMIRYGRRGFKDEKNKLRNTMLVILFLQQASLYAWYFFNDKFNVQDALPLYPCRIWLIAAILLLLTKSDRLYAIVYLMGVPSAVLAFMIPDTGGYGFPNIMFIQFVIGHAMLIIIPIYMYYCRGMRLNSKIAKDCVKVFCVYMISVSIVNHLTGGNYGYVSAPPLGIEVKPPWDFIYPIGYLIFSLASLVIWYKVSKMAGRKLKSSA